MNDENRLIMKHCNMMGWIFSVDSHKSVRLEPVEQNLLVVIDDVSLE